MNHRKNPKFDLEKKRPMFFSIGLCITMGLVLTAFEFSTPVEPIIGCTFGQEVFEPVIPKVVLTRHERIKPPQPIVKHINPIINPVSDNEVLDALDKVKVDLIPEEDPIPVVFSQEGEMPAEIIEEAPLTWTDRMPVPVGGMDAFYEYLKKHMIYPSKARRMNIQGRVFVSFVISKTGEISEVKSIKGIGAGCDEEAIRVIKNYPKWEAGSKEGKPVAVRMIMPVGFIMN